MWLRNSLGILRGFGKLAVTRRESVPKVTVNLSLWSPVCKATRSPLKCLPALDLYTRGLKTPADKCYGMAYKWMPPSNRKIRAQLSREGGGIAYVPPPLRARPPRHDPAATRFLKPVLQFYGRICNFKLAYSCDGGLSCQPWIWKHWIFITFFPSRGPYCHQKVFLLDRVITS